MTSITNLLLFPIRKVLGTLLTVGSALTQPKAMQRDVSQQAKVDAQTAGLILYHFEGCPFCLKSRRHIQKLGLKIELRNIQKSKQFEEELTNGGGEYQVPCLRIPSTDGSVQWLYESTDINHYLSNHFETP